MPPICDEPQERIQNQFARFSMSHKGQSSKSTARSAPRRGGRVCAICADHQTQLLRIQCSMAQTSITMTNTSQQTIGITPCWNEQLKGKELGHARRSGIEGLNRESTSDWRRAACGRRGTSRGRAASGSSSERRGPSSRPCCAACAAPLAWRCASREALRFGPSHLPNPVSLACFAAA